MHQVYLLNLIFNYKLNMKYVNFSVLKSLLYTFIPFWGLGPGSQQYHSPSQCNLS